MHRLEGVVVCPSFGSTYREPFEGEGRICRNGKFYGVVESTDARYSLIGMLSGDNLHFWRFSPARNGRSLCMLARNGQGFTGPWGSGSDGLRALIAGVTPFAGFSQAERAVQLPNPQALELLRRISPRDLAQSLQGKYFERREEMYLEINGLDQNAS